MKHIVLFVLCALSALQKMSAFADKSLGELQQMAFLHPEETLAQLDSLQDDYSFPSYRLNFVRSCSFFALYRFNEALASIRSVCNSAEFNSDISLQKRVCMMYAETAVFSFSMEEAMDCILKGKQLALTTNDDVLMSHLIMTEAILYRSLGLNYKSYELAIKAINLAKKVDDKDFLTLIVQFKSCGGLMSFYLYDEKYIDAMHYAQETQDILGLFKEETENSGLYDMYSAIFYGRMAYLGKKMEKDSLAQSYYQRFCHTNFAKTSGGKQEINDYLLLAGRYDEVLSNTMEYLDEMNHQDTLNVFYVRLLNHRRKAYVQKEKFKEAFQIAERVNDMQKLMLVNKDKDHLFEIADVGELMVLKKNLSKANRKISVYQLLFAIFIIILVGMVFLLGGLVNHRLVYRYYRRKKKNLANKSFELLQKEEELPLLMPNVVTRKEEENCGISDAELFNRFNLLVRKEKYFLNYQLGRDDYARIMQVDKNRFASIMKEYSGGNMATYINNLRLEYSIRLLRENVEMSILEVAVNSAIPNVSTYYRLFKDKYGMSPAEYRNRLK